MLNNVGYAMAVEKLLGIDEQIPERAQYIRVIVGELSRITDHLTCLGATRDGARRVHRRSSTCSRRASGCTSCSRRCRGARLTHSYVRIGGVVDDLPDGLRRQAARHRSRAIASRDGRRRASCSISNRIFRDRMDGIGIITQGGRDRLRLHRPDRARSTGVAYDVRKDHPYLVYDRFDFDVPVGTDGDNFDRFLVRVEEINQSMRILDQALAQIPAGPVMVDDPRVALPPKSETYNTIEAMIRHFKHIMDGIRSRPARSTRSSRAATASSASTSSSDGTGRPWKCRVRPPCFADTCSRWPS